MNRLVVLLFAASSALAACQSMPAPERLVADLQLMGLPAGLGTDFNSVVLGGTGTTVCVGDTSVSVHEFVDVDAAIDAAATINGDDPSNVGNGIVEWVGPPRFWLRDRAIILYVGEDAAVDAALRSILGRPFAESRDPGRGVPGEGPSCQRAS